jgi:hypothetical protein
MDTAPDSLNDGWTDQVSAYWTWGPGESTGTWILTILGIVLMTVAFLAWFYVEDQKLKKQVERLRASGIKTETMPGGEAHHTPTEA